MIKTILRDIKNRVHNKREKSVIIKNGANISDSKLNGYNVVGINSSILSSDLGIGSYLGSECFISHAKIGNFCSIGSRVQLVVGSHPSRSWVSTHPAFFSPDRQAGITFTDKPRFQEKVFAQHDFYIVIGNDVWIGNNVLMLPGITIGDGAILAAGSVVTRDVEPYSIVGGNPARLIRYRFDEEERSFLLSLQWWNRDLEWIREKAKYFDSIASLKEQINEDINNSQ